MIRLVIHTSIVLAGILLTGCQYNYMLQDMREHNPGTDSLAIAFQNGVIENSTKSVTLLSDHMNTMGVWGWQTTPTGIVERTFLNQKVAFNSQLSKWSYSPLKYWDPESSYQFMAYAPHSSADTNVSVSIDSTSHTISIKGITLNGDNTIKTAMAQVPGCFYGVKDIDWMMDRDGQNLQGWYRDEVTFNMQHILSKICVGVRRSPAFAQDVVVSLDSVQIDGLVRQGDFTAARSKFGNEWVTVDTLPRYSMTSVSVPVVTDSTLWALESLVIPQETGLDSNLNIWYTLSAADGSYVNQCSRSYKFRNIDKKNNTFYSLNSGCNYMITIVIAPDVITFDSGVDGWVNKNTQQQYIY